MSLCSQLKYTALTKKSWSCAKKAEQLKGGIEDDKIKFMVRYAFETKKNILMIFNKDWGCLEEICE